MHCPNKRSFFLHLINVSVFVAFSCLILEFILSVFFFNFHLEDFFLVRFGLLNCTICVYLLITFLAVSIAAALLTYLLRNILDRFNFHVSEKIYSFFAILLIILVIMGLRIRLDYTFSELKWYLFPLLFVLVVFLAIHCSHSSERSYYFRLNGLMNRPKTLFLFFSLIIINLALPFLYDNYLELRYSRKEERKSLPNIVLVVMDTVRADFLSCYQNKMNLTPNIDKIAHEGMLFLKAISPSPWTLSTHASIFTGLYPSQHSAGWEYTHLDEEFLTLAEYLSQQGYLTVAFSENPIVSKELGLAQGFGNFHEIYDEIFRYSRQAIAPRVIKKIREKLFSYKDESQYAQDTIRFFKRWMYINNYKTDSRPFFAFLNFMAAHLPNYPRRGFRFCQPSKSELQRIEPINRTPEKFYLPKYRLNERELEIMRRLYEGEIAYLDSRLADLFDFLKNKNILDQTILILTSDHGENFGDHGLIEHQFCLYNSLLHVPLIIRYPQKIVPGSRSKELVSTIYLFKTLLDLIGIPETEDLKTIEKRSLFDTNRNGHNNVIYAEYDNPIEMIKNIIGNETSPDFNYKQFDRILKCIYAGNHKLIWASDGHNEAYDINNDWQETSNSFFENSNLALLLQTEMVNFQRGLWMPQTIRKNQKIDEKTLERLRSLGYIK
jgi:arylsulfatase A-like enzyme